MADEILLSVLEIEMQKIIDEQRAIWMQKIAHDSILHERFLKVGKIN